MKCKRVQKLISIFIDGELKSGEKETIESHLRNCRICAEKMREMEGVQKLFSAAPKHTAPEHFAANVIANLKKGRERGFWFDFFLGEPAYLKMAEISCAIIFILIGMISGSVLFLGSGVHTQTEIRSSFSLDVFEPAPSNSIGGAYISILGGSS